MNATPVSHMSTRTLRGIDNAQYAIKGLERAWWRSSLSDAYTEAVRQQLETAKFRLAGGDYVGAQDAVAAGWQEMEAGS